MCQQNVISPSPFIFIDRDDTLIYDVPYLKDPNGVRLSPGAGEALRRLWDAGFKIALVSNQSGVGRGLVSPEELARVQLRLVELLAVDGAGLDGVYICPHAPTENCGCRKPRTGLLEQACADHAVDRSRSFFIGDSSGDIEAGKSFGLKTIQIRLPGLDKPLLDADFCAETLLDAVTFVLNQK